MIILVGASKKPISKISHLVRATITDRSAWIGSGGLPWISPLGRINRDRDILYPSEEGAEGSCWLPFLDNPPLVPLQLPSSRQGFAVAAVSRGLPNAQQTEAWSMQESSRSALCVRGAGDTQPEGSALHRGAAAQSATQTPRPLTILLACPWRWVHQQEPKLLLALLTAGLAFSSQQPFWGYQQ